MPERGQVDTGRRRGWGKECTTGGSGMERKIRLAGNGKRRRE